MPAACLARRSIIVALLVVLVSYALPGGAAAEGLKPEDFYDFQFVSDPQMAPDGNTIAFVRATVSEDRRKRESAIWLVASDGNAPPRQFTRDTTDRNPRWSPDGRSIAFISGREERAQLHLISMAGGEARAVTELKQGSISDFAWLPDSRYLLLTLSIDPSVDDPNAKADEDEDPKPDLKRFRHAVYKSDGRGYLDESRRGLWLLDSEDGTLRRLTGHADWNDSNAAVSPDGALVAFDADRTGTEYDGGFNQDLHLLTLANGEVIQVDTPPGRAWSPVFSPDGRFLLYRHQSERYAPITVQRIPVAGGSHQVLHDGLDLTVSDLLFPAAGQGPYLRADYRGARPVFRLDRNGRTPAVAGSEASINALSFSADGRRMAYIEEDEVRLAEVWTARSDGSRARQLTRFNEDFLASRELGRLERFTFSNEDDMEVDGFLLRPIGFEDGRRYPLVLNIKGGPGGMWGHQWFQEFQMLAAAGFGVVFTNYRGSTGYGHDFQSAVRLDYGGADYRDNMLLLEAALERFDWIDPERLFVTGGSHGGFLTNWITTQTDRFRAAVTQRSVSNWISEAGTQEYPPASMTAEFGGTIWTNFDYYWGRSPLKYADQVSTPTLVIHSSDDHITPVGQGQEWFYALLANDVETEFALFEGESHGLSRGGTPVNLVARLELIIEWFQRYDDQDEEGEEHDEDDAD